jgi:hypothetical protein
MGRGKKEAELFLALPPFHGENHHSYCPEHKKSPFLLFV